MAQSVTLNVEYGVTTGDDECSGVLFEIPTTEVIGGDVIEIRLWGISKEILVPYSLRRGTVNLGLGTDKVMPVDDIVETVVFVNARSVNTIWVIDTLISVVADGLVTYDDAGTPTEWATDGEDKTSSFASSSNILNLLDIESLSGNFIVTYRSTSDVQELVDFAETSKFQCTWPMLDIQRVVALQELVKIDPVTGNVIRWCKEGQDVTSLFRRQGYSCLAVADNTALFGSVMLEYTRSPYYKVWEWEVPVGAQGQYWFFIYEGSLPKNKFSIEIPDLTEGLPEPRNIALKIVDRDSGNLLDGALVWIDEVYRGTTDANGVLFIDGIMTGSHTIRSTKTGFIDTDLDNLYNDTLEIY